MPTPAQVRATTKYEHNNYDKITVRLKKSGEITRQDIQAAADQAGESLNQYIINAVKMRIDATKATK